VTLSRAAKIGKGATQLTPAQTFDLKPGEKTVASFRPPADEEDDDSE
jgi:hypothetical protein